MSVYKSYINKQYEGILYIVPTPIGNLLDITYRAVEILKTVNMIAAENIQHTTILLNHFHIKNNIISLNKNNEKKKNNYFINQLKQGKKIAIISNAGTPIINDPGYYLVKECHINNIQITPLPGACAAITALVASGITANRFCYEGFIPSKKKQRYNFLKSLQEEERTIIFYETKHRILESIQDITKCMGDERYITLAKEMTKKWEFIYKAQAKTMLDWIKNNKNFYKGEIVIIIEGFIPEKNKLISKQEINTFNILNSFLTMKQSILITSQIHKTKKNNLYQYIIKKEGK